MDPADTALIEGTSSRWSTGFHINSNGHAVYYNPKDMASGDYTVSATFSQAKSMGHEAYGIFIGGSNMQDYDKQDYLYFDIRPFDGQILITHRVGMPDPHAIIAFPRTARGAAPPPAVAGVNKEGADGSATNTLTIRVHGDSVHFIANGTEVKAYPKSALLGASTNGQVGIQGGPQPRRPHRPGTESRSSPTRNREGDASRPYRPPSMHTLVSTRSMNVIGRSVLGIRTTSTGDTASLKQPHRAPCWRSRTTA